MSLRMAGDILGKEICVVKPLRSIFSQWIIDMRGEETQSSRNVTLKGVRAGRSREDWVAGFGHLSAFIPLLIGI